MLNRLNHKPMKKFLAFMFLAGLVSSCQNEMVSDSAPNVEEGKILLTKDEALSIANDNPTTLTEEEVLEMVNGFSNSLAIQTRSIGNPKVSASIAGMHRVGGVVSNANTRSASTDSIPVYEVRLTSGDKQGYALVSADTRSAGILAYVENGSYENRDSTGAGMMLALAEATTVAEINKVERLKAELRDKTLTKVATAIGKSSVTYDEVKDLIEVEGVEGNEMKSRSKPVETPSTQIVSMMPQNGGAVLKTEWGQENPYNIKLPNCYNEDHADTHYPLGCGVTAALQTLAAIGPSMTIDGTVIDWPFLTKKPQIIYYPWKDSDYEEAMMVSKVAKHVYEGTKSTPIIKEDFEYGNYDDPNIPCVIGSSTNSTNLLSYLNTYISCGTFYDRYEPDALLNGLNGNRIMPCVAIMGGTRTVDGQVAITSHAWVIDGYAICIKASREILKNNDVYFHANMGWYGQDDGFYKVNADSSIEFETEDNGIYNVDFWEITDIHKK